MKKATMEPLSQQRKNQQIPCGEGNTILVVLTTGLSLAFIFQIYLFSLLLQRDNVILKNSAVFNYKRYFAIANSLSVRNNTPTSSSFCITFLGDTMMANSGVDAAHELSHPRDSFRYIQPLIQKCETVIANLEGPITHLGLDSDPLHQGPSYSFNMNPDLLPHLLIEQGITKVNRANNHLRDRGEAGAVDTNHYLDASGIDFFGCGRTKQEAAKPLLLNIDNEAKTVIGITGYSDYYGRGVLPSPKRNQTGILPVTKEHALLGRQLLDQHNVTLRIAFVHWGGNYEPVSNNMRQQAKLLVKKGGYDLILGSDGSHTVQEFDYVDKVPVLYNIGNFLFQTPGRFQKSTTKSLPYGLVTHLHLDPSGQRFKSLELHCTHVDNRKVHFQPRICTKSQAAQLFGSLGPHVRYRKGNSYATVMLDSRDKNRPVGG
jgi:hypothetical protein